LELVEDVEELTVEELEAGPGGVSFGAGGRSGGGGPGLEMAIGHESLPRIAVPESARSLGVATASLQSNPQIETKSHPTKVDFILRSSTVEVATLEDVGIV